MNICPASNILASVSPTILGSVADVVLAFSIGSRRSHLKTIQASNEHESHFAFQTFRAVFERFSVAVGSWLPTENAISAKNSFFQLAYKCSSIWDYFRIRGKAVNDWRDWLNRCQQFHPNVLLVHSKPAPIYQNRHRSNVSQPDPITVQSENCVLFEGKS